MTAALPPIEDVLLHALADTGQRYVYGAKGDPLQPVDTSGIDCSGLVKRSCDRAGVRFPVCPDGSWNQWNLIVLHGRELPVEQAMHTRGALMFIGAGGSSHVAWSLGDKTTIEARGSAWGVGTWAAAGRFQLAGLLPGIDYTPKAYQEEDFMQTHVITVDADDWTPARAELNGQLLASIPVASVASWWPLGPHDVMAGAASSVGPSGELILKGRGQYAVVTHS